MCISNLPSNIQTIMVKIFLRVYRKNREIIGRGFFKYFYNEYK